MEMETITQDKPKSTGLFKIVLWSAVGAFALSAFLTVLMILFTDFDNFAQRDLFGRVIFIMWQTLWFGGIAILFADRFDKNPLPLAKTLSIIGVVFTVLSLIIGIGQALDIYAVGPVGEKLQTILAIFLYSSIFAELILIISRPIPSVVIARNTTVAVVGVFDIIATFLIAIDYASSTDMMARLIAAFAILAIVGLIITCILNSIHKDQLPPLQSSPLSGPTGYPTFVPVTPATPLNSPTSSNSPAKSSSKSSDDTSPNKSVDGPSSKSSDKPTTEPSSEK